MAIALSAQFVGGVLMPGAHKLNLPGFDPILVLEARMVILRSIS